MRRPCLHSPRKALRSHAVKPFPLSAWCHLVAASCNRWDCYLLWRAKQAKAATGAVAGREFKEARKEGGNDWKARRELFFWDPGCVH